MSRKKRSLSRKKLRLRVSRRKMLVTIVAMGSLASHGPLAPPVVVVALVEVVVVVAAEIPIKA